MKPNASRHLLLLVTEDWYFWSHRRALAEAALEAGYRVSLATRVGELGDAIRERGVEVHPVRLRRAGRAPLAELAALAELAGLYRRLRPDLVHHVGVKPMLYGAAAARLARVRRVVQAQPGLGYVFTADGVRARTLQALVASTYRAAWAGAGTRVIFQNRENLDFFVARGLIGAERAALIRGVGVDLDAFRVRPEPEGAPVVMLAARMLWDKGIGETVEAARMLRARGVECRLVLVGRPDPANPKAVPEGRLREWHETGVAEWWGYRTDMPEVLAAATVVVMPSYMEGLPKALVEAAAVGRPVVTTDVPGCREVVRDRVNGLLVPPRDPTALADALAELLAAPDARAEMGRRAREIAETEFSQDHASRQTLELYESLF